MLSAFFVERPKFALVISIVLTLAGLVSIVVLPVAEYPNISPPVVTVNAAYPGASASVVEETVGTPIEEIVNGVEGMIYMSSTSANDGSYALNVTFDVGTDPDMALVRVQNRVSLAEPSLPAEVNAQGLKIDKKSPDILMIVSAYSPDRSLDYAFISNYLKINVQNSLKRLPGISSADILGEAAYSMRLWLDPDRMAVLNITTGDIISALKEQNVQVAAGKIGAPPFSGELQSEYTLQAKGRLVDPEEFAQVVLRANPDGSAVYLRDVARVELGQKDYNITGEYNGSPAINLALYLQIGANALETADQVQATLDNLSQYFPSGMEYAVSYDTTRYISTAIKQVVMSLFEAVLLVILITFIFLGSLRATLIPAVAIPVSLIGSFSIMLAMGMSINTVTLFGLILAIGIVVDDAILVIENTDRHLRSDPKMSAKQAVLVTMQEVSGPVVATTLVLLAVFIPVALLPGITGEMYRQFAVTICVAVVISSVNALTLSPVLCSLLLKPGEQKDAAWYKAFNRFFDSITNGYGRGVGWVVRRLSIVALIFAAILGALALGMLTMPSGFVPPEDKGGMLVNVQLPDAASVSRTREVVDKLAGIIEADERINSVTAVRGYSVLSAAGQSNSATLFIEMAPWDEREGLENTVFAITQLINTQARELVPQAQVFAMTPPAIPGMGAVGGLEFVLQDTLGRSYSDLAGVVQNMAVDGNQHPALAGVFSTFRANVPQFFVDVDRVKAKNLGIPLSDIFGTLQAQLGSMYINDFNLLGQTYQVVMMAESSFREDLKDLDRFYVRTASNEMIPLSTLVSLRPVMGPDIATRYNLFRSASIRGAAAPGYSSGQAIKAFEEVAAKNLPDGYRFEWTGMTYQEIKAGNMAIYAFAFALIFIYLFLVAQYESWSMPLAIILVVPIAAAGAVGGLLLTGIAFNLYAQIGLVLLIGMAAKNAILIVEFASNLREQEGKPIAEAAKEAAHLRFRAVNMTAISFIIGILPLVFASGAGMFGQKSLGIPVFFGMLAALVVGTFFIPGFYVIVQSLREKLKGNAS